MLAGPPCAGKSAVGRALAGSSTHGRRVHVEVDAVFSLLLPRSDRNRQDRMLAYDAAHVLARMLLERGHTPVLECTYSRLEQRTSLLAALADVPAVPLRVVELAVCPDDAVRRFRRRQQATDLDEQLVRERALTYPYSDQALRLTSAGVSPDDLAQRVTSWLRQQPAPAQLNVWAQAAKPWD